MVIRLQNVCFEQAAPGTVYFQRSSEILAGKKVIRAAEETRLAFWTAWFSVTEAGQT